MPSERMEFPSLSPSSSLSEELQFTGERPAGFWKTDSGPIYLASKVDATLYKQAVASSPIQKQIALGSRMGKSFDTSYSYNPDQRADLNMEKHVTGVAGATSNSLPRAVSHELGARSNFSLRPESCFMIGDNLDLSGAQRENGLFSSSLSELFSRKLRLSSNNSPYGHSFGAAAPQYEEDEPFESLEELEAQTIGNLLPDDDDLLSGVTNGIQNIAQSYNFDDIEDVDVFSSVGGMDLGDDGLPSERSNIKISAGNSDGNVGVFVGGEHPFREHPSRTLFVRNISSNSEDSELRSLFEQFGDIRTIHTASKHRGFVMISYYDIRAARNAMIALQNKPLRQKKLDIHFSIPKDNPSENDVNQGTLVVFNLESSVTDDELRRIFGVYGEIKEIREAPLIGHKKFIEFYDVRAAEAALHALNQSDIAGKQIKLESCLPGGARRLVLPFSSELDQDEFFLTLPRANASRLFSNGGIESCAGNETIYDSNPASGGTLSGLVHSSFSHVISSSVPNSLPSLMRVGSVGHQSVIGESGFSQGEMKFELGGVPNFHPHSLSEFHDRWGSGISCNSPSRMSSSSSTAVPSEINENQHFCRMNSNGASLELGEVFSPGSGSFLPAGSHFMWGNSPHPQHQGRIWPNSPSFINDFRTHPQQVNTISRAPSQMLTALLPMRNHHVGSAPPVNSSVWDRRHIYSSESPDASVLHLGSLGNTRISGNSVHPFEYVPRNMFPGGGGAGFNSHTQRGMMFPARGQLFPATSSFDSPNERTRIRRHENSSNQVDNKKQFELDLDRIMQGDDKRTTLMIKNIPNKYTSKMLLAAIDEQHRGTYDFIYLPIDFKNKCNVGYAFINMIDASLIIPFYQALNGKKWEKFNSEKVASLAYARIQGKASLIAHFQNSSLMNEDKRCRPILFHTDGPNAGDQVPFPMGVNIRPRPGKTRASTREDIKDSAKSLPNGELSSNGDLTSGSLKDSD